MLGDDDVDLGDFGNPPLDVETAHYVILVNKFNCDIDKYLEFTKKRYESNTENFREDYGYVINLKKKINKDPTFIDRIKDYVENRY